MLLASWVTGGITYCGWELEMPEVDVMAFGPHPDDIELGCGGTLIKLADLGYSVVLVDMTRGEMSTRGTIETRAAESAAAAKILGVVARENLGLPDGRIRADDKARRKVVEVIRRYCPRIALIPYWQDRHPDHYHASELVYEGAYLAGLARYETGQQSYRPPQILYYMRWDEFEPTFVVDISDQYERKMEAIWAYSTQFAPSGQSAVAPEGEAYPETRLVTPEYHWKLEHRMAYYGSLIQKRYGEGFLVRGQLEMEHPLEARFLSF
jgi:bacillithiol biosynthesis deacetylase BshB1